MSDKFGATGSEDDNTDDVPDVQNDHQAQALPPPPNKPGYVSPPHHGPSDPWAFDHDANPAPPVWGSGAYSNPATSSVRYSAAPLHEPASKKPLIIFLVVLVALGAIGGGAAWYFIGNDGLERVSDPEVVSLSVYVEKYCAALRTVQDQAAETAARDAVFEQMLHGDASIPRAEKIEATRVYYRDAISLMTFLMSEIWTLNENFVVDDVQGEFMRQDMRKGIARINKEIADIDALIDRLTPNMSDSEFGAHMEEIASEMQAIDLEVTGDDWQRLDVEFEAAVASLGPTCGLGAWAFGLQRNIGDLVTLGLTGPTLQSCS